MTTFDWILVGFIVLAAVVGMRKGLIVSALSLAGIAIGAVLGARLAPQLLHGGSSSAYTPLAALAGAALLAVGFEVLGSLLGAFLRSGLKLSPLRALDSAGGLIVGGAAAIAIVWVVGAVALQFPGQTKLRRDAQRSRVLRQLNSVVPPSRLMTALSRVDPFPVIAGPALPAQAPDPAVRGTSGVRRAAESVVRVTGLACGLAVEGSGWVAQPGVVVTAAHVVAGQEDTTVQAPGQRKLKAHAIAYDPRNDIAVLRVAGLRARPLVLVPPRNGTPVAIVGYPENGPLSLVAARIGRTGRTLTEDAYGHPTARSITAVRGVVRHGHSGAPAVDSGGHVQATIFASRRGGPGGYGVPDDPVREALNSAHGTVSTGSCS